LNYRKMIMSLVRGACQYFKLGHYPAAAFIRS